MTFAEIYGFVERAIKQLKGSKTALAKEVVNMVYLNEIIPADELYPLYWLRKLYDSRNSVAPATITGITIASPGVFSTDGVHNLVVNDIVSIYSVVGTTEVNNRIFKVNTAPSTSSLTLKDINTGTALDTSSFTAWSSGGKMVHRGITLSSNIERIILASWNDEDSMIEASPESLELNNQWWDDQTARPQEYLYNKALDNAGNQVDELWWFQGADKAYDLRYWAEDLVEPLSADADTPRIPKGFHNMIVAGAITRLAESNVQVENAVVWPSLYANQLSAFKSYNRKFYRDHENERKQKPYQL